MLFTISPNVRVKDSFFVERYSHVMHIVSQVEGHLSAGKTPYDLMRATFPAGTLSGAPKVRAMQIIADLEGTTRGPYGGCVGYFSFNGNTVRLTGFVAGSKGSGFEIARYQIACCAADAIPVVVHVVERDRRFLTHRLREVVGRCLDVFP